jgi:hypothetical protein
VNIKGVPLSDWVSLAVGLIGLVTAYLSRKDRLPAWARKWLSRVKTARVVDAIERAAAIADLSEEARRLQAVDYLQKLTFRELGFTIPDSIANLLVEYVYQQWKRAKR